MLKEVEIKLRPKNTDMRKGKRKQTDRQIDRKQIYKIEREGTYEREREREKE